MATFTLTINTDNDAFVDSNELAELVHRVGDTLDRQYRDGHAYTGAIVWDTNGNNVGRFELSED